MSRRKIREGIPKPGAALNYLLLRSASVDLITCSSAASGHWVWGYRGNSCLPRGLGVQEATELPMGLT